MQFQPLQRMFFELNGSRHSVPKGGDETSDFGRTVQSIANALRQLTNDSHAFD